MFFRNDTMYPNKRVARWKMLLAGAVLAFSATMPAGAADVQVAFVNTPQVLEQAPQAKAARDRLQSEFASRDQDLMSSAKKLKALEEKLARDGAIMSESERRKLERDLISQRREIQRSRDEFNEDFNIRRNEEFSKLQQKVAAAIIDLAKENGYDLILEAGVVYASDKIDITQQVIDRLNKQD